MELLNQKDVPSILKTIQEELPLVLTDEVTLAACSIAFNPFFWNVIGRIEFKSHIVTKIIGGSKYKACYAFAVTIFSLGILRDYLFYEALKTQPISHMLNNDWVKLIGIVSAGIGHILVLSSMWALGITGTYLGDYFGILMDNRVECFPFNVAANPMYTGSFLTFLGVALYEGKAIGLALSALVWVIYRIGLFFEEPFTEKIYATKNKRE